MTFEKPENDSESDSIGIDNSNDMSESEDDSDESNSDASGGDAKKLEACITNKEVFAMCCQRIIKAVDNIPVAVTFSLMAIQDGKKMLGIRAVALNPNICHESGVFFLIDQLKWKEEMKTYTDVSNSV